MVKSNTPWILIAILGVLFLWLNPLGFDIFATFGLEEAGIPFVINQEGLVDTSLWRRGDSISFYEDEINKQLFIGNKGLGSDWQGSLSGKILLVDDTIVELSEGGNTMLNGDLWCGNSGTCIKFLSREWFANKGYSYPSGNWDGDICGTHYIEYIIGVNHWTGFANAQLGNPYFTESWKSGGKTVIIPCPDLNPRPICEEGGTYDEISNECVFIISDITYKCPDGSPPTESNLCIVELTPTYNCEDGTIEEGVCYVTPIIVHDCGGNAKWDEDKGKCISYETLDDEEEEDRKIPMEWWVIGGFVFIFLLVIIMRR